MLWHFKTSNNPAPPKHSTGTRRFPLKALFLMHYRKQKALASDIKNYPLLVLLFKYSQVVSEKERQLHQRKAEWNTVQLKGFCGHLHL